MGLLRLWKCVEKSKDPGSNDEPGAPSALFLICEWVKFPRAVDGSSQIREHLIRATRRDVKHRFENLWLLNRDIQS